MGLFGFGKGKKKSDVVNRQAFFVASHGGSYSQAINLLLSNDADSQFAGRQMMVNLSDTSGNCDPRVSLWMAKDFEENGCLRAAAMWYEIAAKQGVQGADKDYKRCYNPYHIDPFYNIDGTRGCGTPHLRYSQEIKEKAKQDYKSAIEKLNNNPSKDEANNILITIYQIASAKPCSVPDAQQWMGDFFETVQKDNKGAAEWFKKAAENGSVEGARCYADMLISGRGVGKDEEKAIKYYHKAADNGHVESMFVLGQYYFKNNDRDKAYQYFERAADNGFAPAKELLNKLNNGEDIFERPTYQVALDNVYNKIVIDNDLSDSGLVEFYADIFQPDDFCQNVFDYCNVQYEGKGYDKLSFEYNMTAFYGCICSVALWNKKSSDFADISVWNAIREKIDVEFTDRHAEELLGTKNGEDKAENIYALIKEYMRISRAAMELCHYNREACIYAMRLAYKLGMLVAKKELSIQNNNFVREFIVSQEKQDSDCQPIQNKTEFYTSCIKEFHDAAMNLGVATRGLIFIPELIPYGEKIVLNLLKDSFYQSEFSQDPNVYYAFIMSLSIDAGMVCATKWHEDFSGLEKYVAKIMKEGPAEDADKLMKKYLPQKLFSNQGNPFFAKIYPHWVSLHEPYWRLNDPREYTFQLMIAAYQLGVSIILEKYGF